MPAKIVLVRLAEPIDFGNKTLAIMGREALINSASSEAQHAGYWLKAQQL